MNSATILDIVRQNSFAVVGLSVGSETRIDLVSDMIGAIRRVSRNRAVGVLLGGPLLVARPELALLMGADATAADGEITEAVNRRITDADMSDAHIHVDVKAGVARLSGTVARAMDRYSAMVIARSTDGVHSVQDDLRVESTKTSMR